MDEPHASATVQERPHTHTHTHAQSNPEHAAVSLLMQPAWQRVLAALGLVVVLWLAVAWAMGATP